MQEAGKPAAPALRPHRVAIPEAARRRFAAQGYERYAIRAIAADADIDPSRVMRYYRNRSHLFDAALDAVLHLPDLADLPAEDFSRLLCSGHRRTHRPGFFLFSQPCGPLTRPLAAPTTSAAGEQGRAS